MAATIWTLIVFAHVGPLGNGNSNALTSVSGFQNIAACEVAGKEVKKLADGSTKKINYVCVRND